MLFTRTSDLFLASPSLQTWGFVTLEVCIVAPFALHTEDVRQLPQRTGFLYGQPIPKSHAQLLHSFYASDTSGQVRAKQSGVRRFIGEASNCGEPDVYRAGRQQAIFEVNSVSRHYGLVEGQPRLRAVPANEIVNGTPIAALRFW